MTKARIVQRTSPSGVVVYVIQQRHWLFRWMWVDAWINSWLGAACVDSHSTLIEAQQNLCHFDGTPSTDLPLFESEYKDAKHSGGLTVFHKVKCRVGWHNWTWKYYESLDGEIPKSAKCSRCGITHRS